MKLSFNQLSILSRVDKIIIITLIFYFLAYPFIIRNIMGVAYPVMLNSLLLLTFIICLADNPKIIKQKFSGNDKVILASEVLYCFYFFILIVVSIFHYYEPLIILSAAYEIRELLFVLIILFLLSNKALFISLKLYVEFFTWCAALGILLVVLLYLGLISPIAEVNIKYVEGYGNSSRFFYGLGFIWPNTWIGSLFGLERLQSFADEAGTFGFVVLPAIFLATHWRKNTHYIILITALILTFSVGAILVWLFFTFFVMPVLQKKNKIRNILILIMITSVFFVLLNLLPPIIFIYAESYFSSKYTYFGSIDTSLGQRFDGISIVINKIQENPFGFGANSAGIKLGLLGASLGVGWLIPLVEAGVLGWIFYLVAFGILLLHAVKNAIISFGIKQVLAIVILINGIAALQRAGIDANLWHMYWLVAYLRIISMNYEKYTF